MAILAVALASSWFILGDYKSLVRNFGPDRVWKYSKLNKRVVFPPPPKGGKSMNGAQMRDHIDYLIECNYDGICALFRYSGLKREKKYIGECHTLELMRMRRAAHGPEWYVPPNVCKNRGLNELRRSKQCKTKRHKPTTKPKKKCKVCKKRAKRKR